MQLLGQVLINGVMDVKDVKDVKDVEDVEGQFGVETERSSNIQYDLLSTNQVMTEKRCRHSLTKDI